jgi:hypothetical protein
VQIETRARCHPRSGAGAPMGVNPDPHPMGAKPTEDQPRGCRLPSLFLHHVRDVLTDVFLLVLLACAAVSLGFGIKEHGLRDGWYDRVNIFFAINKDDEADYEEDKEAEYEEDIVAATSSASAADEHGPGLIVGVGARGGGGC